jgi:hypothetical protein
MRLCVDRPERNFGDWDLALAPPVWNFVEFLDDPPDMLGRACAPGGEEVSRNVDGPE